MKKIVLLFKRSCLNSIDWITVVRAFGIMLALFAACAGLITLGVTFPCITLIVIALILILGIWVGIYIELRR